MKMVDLGDVCVILHYVVSLAFCSKWCKKWKASKSEGYGLSFVITEDKTKCTAYRILPYCIFVLTILKIQTSTKRDGTRWLASSRTSTTITVVICMMRWACRHHTIPFWRKISDFKFLNLSTQIIIYRAEEKILFQVVLVLVPSCAAHKIARFFMTFRLVTHQPCCIHILYSMEIDLAFAARQRSSCSEEHLLPALLERLTLCQVACIPTFASGK